MEQSEYLRRTVLVLSPFQRTFAVSQGIDSPADGQQSLTLTELDGGAILEEGFPGEDVFDGDAEGAIAIDLE